MRSSLLSLACVALAASVTAGPVPRAEDAAAPKYTLFTLPYGPADLMPYISNETNALHLGKLANAAAGLNQVGTGLSALLAAPSLNITALYAASQLLTTLTGALETHYIYFSSLCPTAKGGGYYSMASPALAVQVTKDFGSYANMITALNAETMEVPASGWGWLVYDTKIKALDTTYTVDGALLEPTLLPIINIDIWEHAFFLDTGGNKTEYLSNLEHLYNWEYASSAFANATGPVAPTANATMMAMMA